jgi:hypothetical protein
MIFILTIDVFRSKIKDQKKILEIIQQENIERQKIK